MNSIVVLKFYRKTELSFTFFIVNKIIYFPTELTYKSNYLFWECTKKASCILHNNI